MAVATGEQARRLCSFARLIVTCGGGRGAHPKAGEIYTVGILSGRREFFWITAIPGLRPVNLSLRQWLRPPRRCESTVRATRTLPPVRRAARAMRQRSFPPALLDHACASSRSVATFYPALHSPWPSTLPAVQ